MEISLGLQLTIFILFASVILVPGQDFTSPQCSQLLRKDGILESPEIPAQGVDWGCNVTLDGEGLGVNITLERLKLDASLGDYLTINPGQSLDLRSSAVFSWTISQPLQLVIPSRDAFFVRLVVVSREKKAVGLGFKLAYDSNEVPTPPPSTTTSTTPLPAPPNQQPIPTVDVYVGGAEPEKFVEKIEEFKSAVANVSNIFCERTNITRLKPIQPKHVEISIARHCPFNWPDAAHCIEIEMAVRVFTPASSDYELSAAHLKQMWNMMRGGDYLPNNWFVYDPPTKTSLIWWVGVFFGVVFLFVMLIVLTWRVEIHQSSASKFRKTSTVMQDLNWPKPDMTVSSAQVHVPPYLVMEQPPEDAPSRKFFYEERNSFAQPDGIVNDTFENDEIDDDDDSDGHDLGELDIVSSRNFNNYIYDSPDNEYQYQLQDEHLGDDLETNL